MDTGFQVSASLHVLHQLPHLLENAFDFHDVARDDNVAGLGANRVRFTEHLLRQELQLTAGTFRFFKAALELLQVARKPDDFFRNVASLGENRDLPDKVTTVYLYIQFGEKTLDALLQPVAIDFNHGRNPSRILSSSEAIWLWYRTNSSAMARPSSWRMF